MVILQQWSHSITSSGAWCLFSMHQHKSNFKSGASEKPTNETSDEFSHFTFGPAFVDIVFIVFYSALLRSSCSFSPSVLPWTFIVCFVRFYSRGDKAKSVNSKENGEMVLRILNNDRWSYQEATLWLFLFLLKILFVDITVFILSFTLHVSLYVYELSKGGDGSFVIPKRVHSQKPFWIRVD